VVGQVCQADDPGLQLDAAHRSEAKLIGFLEKLIQLANPALDDITHDGSFQKAVVLLGFGIIDPR
jgi:hypothetical protein